MTGSATSQKLGTQQVLEVLRRVRAGVLLDGDALGEILLPEREAPAELAAGDSVRVFLYADREGRPVATRALPLAVLGEVALLGVVSNGPAGAFLDWGLPKDLLLPFAEQRGEPRPGDAQLVRVVSDRDGRPVATARLDRQLLDVARDYQQGDAVALVAVQPTALGWKVAVDHRYWGLVGQSELREPLVRGQQLRGYIGRLRDDGRLSISLHPPGAAKTTDLTGRILQQLDASGGYLPLNDKSPPDAVFAVFACSKSAYKQAIGKLYRARRIAIEKDGIRRL